MRLDLREHKMIKLYHPYPLRGGTGAERHRAPTTPGRPLDFGSQERVTVTAADGLSQQRRPDPWCAQPEVRRRSLTPDHGSSTRDVDPGQDHDGRAVSRLSHGGGR